ncbi:MAG: M28 family peptidase [Bacteroidota bacterium]
MNRNTLALLVFAAFGLMITACQDDSASQTETTTTTPSRKKVVVPKFERDSAYAYVEKQLSFGPRVPGTEAHAQCKDWMADKLRSFGADVILQDFDAERFDGLALKGTNVIGRFNPAAKKRIMLSAHWDSRYTSDYDPDEANKDKPVPGADDGASGVAVLLEIARHFKTAPIDEYGVDIIFWDLEDQGEGGGNGDMRSWCLGSQYWSRNKHVGGYNARYGILLDMVGAENARFTKDGISRQYAPALVEKVWKMGNNMGYGDYFQNINGRELVDDHLFLNQLAGIPTIDIINRPEGSETGFGHYWHTQKDDMAVISKRTLRAVGQTVLAVVYHTDGGTFL